VGRPGIGKGEAIFPVSRALRKANTANVLSDRLTIEWIKDTMAKGFPTTNTTASGGIAVGTDSACIIIAPELSVFLRFPEDELPDLADLWDANVGPNMYATRGKGLVTITDPCPCILSGCAPEWLKAAVPPSAIGGGFTRRVNFVFARESKQSNAWPDPIDWDKVIEPFIDDLRRIAQLRGEYKFDNLARPMFEKLWNERFIIDADADEATTHYSISRWANASKLAMSIAASRSDDLVITKEMLEEADDMTSDVRADLKIVFRSVGESEMVNTMDKVIQFIEVKGAATIKQIQSVVWRDCTSPELDVIMTTLRDGGVVESKTVGGREVYVCKVASPSAVRRRTKAKSSAMGAGGQPSYGII
jgi:hypothetical protein